MSVIVHTYRTVIALVSFSIFLNGCILFSPYANPVVKPLESGEVEVEAGYGSLPRFFSDGRGDPGFEGGIRFSPANRLMISGRLWSSVDSWEDAGGRIDGYGLDASLLLADPDQTDILHLAPTIHIQYGSQVTEVTPTGGHPGPVDSGTVLTSGIGYGIGLNVWTPTSNALHPFVGGSIRRYSISTEGNEGRDDVLTFGLHGGLGYELTDHLTLAAELVFVFEYPEEAEIREGTTRSYFLTPMVRAAWKF